MYDRLDALAGRTFPSPPAHFRERIEAAVRPVLNRRRWIRRGSGAALFALCVLVGLVSVLPTGRERLEGLSVPQLLTLQELRCRDVPRTAGSLAWMSPAEIVEMADLVAHVRILESTINKDRLIDDILAERWRPLYVTLELEVIKSYPQLKEERVSVRGTLGRDDLAIIKGGREWIIALKRRGEVLTPIYSFSPQGVYQVTRGNVSGLLAPPAGSLPVEQAWEMIRDLYDRVHGTAEDDEAVREGWRSKLAEGDLADCLAALEYLSSLPQPAVRPEVLVDAIERQREELLARLPGDGWTALPPEGYSFTGFAGEALGLLAKVADNNTVEHMVKLYADDLSTPRSALAGLEMPMVYLVLAVPGPSRAERFLFLYETRVVSEVKTERSTRFFNRSLVQRKHEAIQALEDFQGDDIDEILLMMFADPRRFHLGTSLDLWPVINTLAKRGNTSIREPLEAFLANPEEVSLGVRHYEDLEGTVRMVREVLVTLAESQARGDDREHNLRQLIEAYRQGSTWLAGRICWLIEPGDDEAIAALREMPMADVAYIVARKVPDPSFAPLLREALEPRVTASLLEALHACGAESEALDMALAELTKPLPNRNKRAVRDAVQERSRIVAFVGRTGDPPVVPLLEKFIGEEIPAQARNIMAAAPKEDSPPGGPKISDDLRRTVLEYALRDTRENAILALTRLRAESAMALLEEEYLSDDPRRRIVAAVALYYLGDETGLDLLRKFTQHDERSVPEINDLYMMQGMTADFQRAIRYLRSPRTDALFLERIRNGFGDGDYNLAGDFAFAKDHEAELLPLLVDYLESTDREARHEAYYALNAITGSNFGFDYRQLAGQQPKVVAEWRDYVNSYLANQTGDEDSANE